MYSFVTRFLRDDRGQDMAEYAIMLAVIAGASLAAVTLLGTTITGIFTKIEASFPG